jgi:hypothetical protein
MSNATRWYAHGPLTGTSSAVYPLDVPITAVVLASEYDAVVAELKIYKKEYQDADDTIGDVPTHKNRLSSNIIALKAARDRLFATLLDRDSDLALTRAERDNLASRIHLLQQHLDSTTADRDRWAVRVGEAEDRIVDLGNRCLLAEAERDRLKARGDLYSELAEALGDDPCDSHKSRVEHAQKLKAERDRLAATVERVRALRTDGFDQNAAHSYVLRDNLDNALADPVKDVSPFYYCELKKTVGCNGTAGPHGYGRCVERRKGKP